jgi:hypothetical protein
MKPKPPHVLMLTSPAFEKGGKIPFLYTCDGNETIPPLDISGVPPQALSLALILDDPDTSMGVFTHWVKWNIPATTSSIAEGVDPGGETGKGSSGQTEYVGPCPPAGTHHYHFKVYALDTKITLPPGSSKQQLEHAMKGHVIDQAELVGLYEKKKVE